MNILILLFYKFVIIYEIQARQVSYASEITPLVEANRVFPFCVIEYVNGFVSILRCTYPSSYNLLRTRDVCSLVLPIVI